MSRRRAASPDPVAAARVAALLAHSGWTPPGATAPSAPAPPAALAAPAVVPRSGTAPEPASTADDHDQDGGPPAGEVHAAQPSGRASSAEPGPLAGPAARQVLRAPAGSRRLRPPVAIGTSAPDDQVTRSSSVAPVARRAWTYDALGQEERARDDGQVRPDGGARSALADDWTAAEEWRAEPPAPGPDVGVRPAVQAGPSLTSSPLERWRAARVDPGRRGVVALALVAVVAAGFAALVALRGRPHEVVAPAVVVSGVPVPGGRTDTTPSPPAAQVVVSVGGLVVRPGLVTLAPGSRVADAVTAAGGALPGADVGLLNLARKVVDGEQVLVGIAAPPAAAGGPAAPASGGTGGDGVVDLNTATAADLDSLPGIGPVLAQRIVDWRTQNGPFGSVDQLREVGGIGESKFADLEARVRV